LNEEIDSHYVSKDLLAKERSENSRFQRELADYSRKVTDAIVETQEMERRRIARELHDGIGNTLSMTKLLLSSIAQELDGAEGSTGETIGRALELLDNAVTESRQLSRDLASETLIEHGLIPTLNEMIGRVNASGTLKADLQVFGIAHALPRHIEQNLFRIIQELINNVIKHAQATEITLQCIQHEAILVVMIEDNGIGMKDGTVRYNPQGMGLANIQTRLSLLDGSMSIDTEPRRGTIITLEIPLPPA
jgi:signal transduction histidine kinase